MHTTLVIGGGFLMLAIALFASRWLGFGAREGALYFIPVWLVMALGNLWNGVASGGYSITEEIPFFLLVFGIPALAAGVAALMLISRTR